MDIQKKIGDAVTTIDPVEIVYNLERQAIVDLMTEVVKTADIVGQTAGGETVYLMHLTPRSADALAALFADQEGDPLELGEEEHDGREPDGDEV